MFAPVDDSTRAALNRIPSRLYKTRRGAAHVGDSLDLLTWIPDSSVQLIMTSPPFALTTRKAYGNVEKDAYIKWFREFAKEFHRILRDDGSLVIDIGGSWVRGAPVRSIYHFELLVDLVKEDGFFLAEEFFWFNRAKLPSPAQWVNVERIRVKDAVNPIWWLSKTERPKADNRRVLKPYSKGMEHLLRKGSYNEGLRPSGWNISDKFTIDNGGAIPPNLIEVANTRSGDEYQLWCRLHGLEPHPARMPSEIPDFFVRFLTDEFDLVLDPFAGSNVTGAIAESHLRRWLSFEIDDAYLRGSAGRFDPEKVEWT
jgi:DNA modification methylase